MDFPDLTEKEIIVLSLLTIAIILCIVNVPVASVNIINNIIAGLLGMAISDKKNPPKLGCGPKI